MATIELTDLRHEYDNGHVGLDSINLHVHDGEFLALLGPSGSGKTTLLRTIAGFLRPTSGTLEIGGRIVAGQGSWIPPERRGLGMVFQDHAIWPHLNVAANIGYPLKLAGVPRAEISEFTDAPDDLLAHLMRVAKIIGQAQKDAWGAPRAALIVAGFEVPHLHVHVLPAWGEGELAFSNARTDVAGEEMDADAERLRAQLTTNGHADCVPGDLRVA